MHKKLTLLIFLFPLLLFAQQTQYKNGAISIDFGKKKPKSDTIQPVKQPYSTDDDEEDSKPKKEKKVKVKDNNSEALAEDWKKDGIFKAIPHIGINGAQIDGDGYAGYNKIGLDVGVGALIRFHKFVSVSMELNYSMLGAKQRLVTTQNGSDSSRFLYRVQWDYVEVPISINVQDKKFVMFSLGLTPAVMVRYQERNEVGDDDTNNPPNGQPRRFDLRGFAALHFFIQQHYGFGIKFAYSFLSIRGAQYPGLSRVLGEYNNVLTLRFMYIIDKTTFKKKH
jgi:hypothetical protein